MANTKYYCLSERNSEFKTGYLIVQNSLFQIEDSNLIESWELDGNQLEDKVAEAREKAGLSSRKRVYYDDEGYFSEDSIICNNGLVEDSLSEDEESFVEYQTNH